MSRPLNLTILGLTFLVAVGAFAHGRWFMGLGALAVLSVCGSVEALRE